MAKEEVNLSYMVLFGILIGLFIVSFIFPIRKNSSTTNTYVFNVTYVNGDTRNVMLELPSDIEYQLTSDRGSYYLHITSTGKTIWGYKSIVGISECSVSGVLYVNSITKK